MLFLIYIQRFELKLSDSLLINWDKTSIVSVTETLLLMRNKLYVNMRKPDFFICKNKDADQLRGKRAADQHLCFCYIDGIIPLLPKFEISSI